MAEYIERDALKQRFRLRLNWLKKDIHDEYSGALFDGCETDMDLIDEILPEDVAPVRHGRWIPKRKVYRTPGAKNHTCSECGLEVSELWHYCKNCGAQMDGERKENENG